ncbi:Flp family type IVb pilin [Vibrio casei]|uniref:Flp family type IVb pilin n=1 Tax=Vibrio casei TaxID=673372 RepID=UPI00097E947E|nr:Flp family type IVb pilin [Vibrio casei]SJN22810.1 hypothetical protein FM109_04425 [Vibrio casei]
MKIQSLNDYMTQAWCKLAAFSRDEKGASGIEYVLVATIAALAIALYVGSDGSIGSKIKTALDSVVTALS